MSEQWSCGVSCTSGRCKYIINYERKGAFRWITLEKRKIAT